MNLVELNIPFPSNLPLDKPAELLEAIRCVDATTPDGYLLVAEMLKSVKRLFDVIEGGRKDAKKPVDEAARAIQAHFRPALVALEQAEEMAKSKIGAYQRQQEAIRREEQRKADELAARERERQEKIAANNREKARLLEEQGKAAAAAKALERADAAEERGAHVVPPIIQREAPKVAGLTSRDAWKAEVTDLRALVNAIAAGEAPLSLVMPNDKVIGQQARSLQKEFVAPGVRVWSEKQMASGR